MRRRKKKTRRTSETPRVVYVTLSTHTTQHSILVTCTLAPLNTAPPPPHKLAIPLSSHPHNPTASDAHHTACAS